MRAPISMSMAARSICLDSFRTLLAGVDMAGSRVLQADQRTSETRLAIRMLACSVLVAPLPILLLLWLVSKLQTISSSTRKLASKVLREASFSTWAADSAASRSHDSSFSRSEEHTSELQSPCNLVCRLLLE